MGSMIKMCFMKENIQGLAGKTDVLRTFLWRTPEAVQTHACKIKNYVHINVGVKCRRHIFPWGGKKQNKMECAKVQRYFELENVHPS